MDLGSVEIAGAWVSPGESDVDSDRVSQRQLDNVCCERPPREERERHKLH